MITKSSGNVGYDYPDDFSFSRASSGYNSKGKLFTNNQLRLESSIYGGAMSLVEESSTNLITPSSLSGWSLSSVTSSQDSTYEFTLTLSSDLASGGAFMYRSFSYSGTTETFSVEIKGSGDAIGQSVRWQCSAESFYGDTVTLTSSYQKLSSTITFTADSRPVGLACSSGTLASGSSISIRFLKVEAKAYPTSFCVGTRTAETLTMPTTDLSVDEGTIEGIVELTDVAKRQDGSNYPMLFKLIASSGSGIRMFHNISDENWVFALSSSSATTTVSLADSNTPNGLYYYKAYWSSTTAVAEFWNLQTQTKVATATISTPSLPEAFGNYVYIGTLGSQYFLNTRFGTHRLSSTARTTDPDFTNLMPRDDDTLYLMDFDDINFRTIKNMVL